LCICDYASMLFQKYMKGRTTHSRWRREARAAPECRCSVWGRYDSKCNTHNSNIYLRCLSPCLRNCTRVQETGQRMDTFTIGSSRLPMVRVRNCPKPILQQSRPKDTLVSWLF
jgi:hypothetical protein